MNSLLVSDIRQHIIALDKDYELDFATITAMAETLSEFVERATLKYIAGKKEHGGKLSDRDCLMEAYKENLDIFWYLTTELSKRKL